MRVIRDGRTIVDCRASAEPADDRITEDFYASQPQICLRPNPNSRQKLPELPTEVFLDDSDAASLIACALRHPRLNIRQAVLAAIWSEPEAFRRVFEFGLDAPEAYPEIRKIVAEALAKRTPAASNQSRPGTGLLPRMPLPAHLRDRERRE
jgi:hypothetical protein